MIKNLLFVSFLTPVLLKMITRMINLIIEIPSVIIQHMNNLSQQKHNF